MAEKELPPLRVRIIGDSKELSTAVDDAVKNIQKVFKNIKIDVAVQHAKDLKANLNQIQLNSLLMQMRHTKSALQDIARIKMTPLDKEVNGVLKKFERLNKIFSNLQKGAFAGIGGTGGSSGPGAQIATVLAAAAASIAKSMSDALIKAAPHAGKAMSQAMTTGLREAGRILTATANQLGTVFRSLGAVASSLQKVIGSAVSAIHAGAHIFRSASNLAVAGLRSGASVLTAAIRSTGNVLSSALRAAGQVTSSAIRAAGQVAGNAIRGVARVVSTAIQQGGRIASQAIRSAGQVVSQAIRSAGQVAAASISAAVKGYTATTRMVSSMFATLGRTLVGLSRSAATVMSSAIRSSGQMASQVIRGAFQIGSQAIRSAGQVMSQSIRASAAATNRRSPAGGGGGGGLGQGLTSRADIYMHTNAIKNLSQSGRGLLELAGNYEVAQIGIEAFTGSAQKAAEVMKEIQDYAIASPYQTVQIAEMARNMMSYGVSADDAMASIKALGDVAGGSGLRLERLSFAMSQISSLTRLQGQELRQLTEQGFNPLRTISKHTGKSIAELTDIMQKGGISAKAVREALKAETSAGGDFAGFAAKMQNSLPGLTNQLKELAQKLGLDLVKAIETDLKNALRVVIERLKEFIRYINTPEGKKFVKQFADMALLALKVAFTFHMVGLAVATLRWQISSITATFSALRIVLFPILMILRLMLSPLGLLTYTIQGLFTRSIAGFASFGTSIIGALGSMALLGIAIAKVRDLMLGNKGLVLSFKDIPMLLKKAEAFVKGFFSNFQENVKILVDWIKSNWTALSNYSGALFNSMLDAFLSNMVVTASALTQLFTIALQHVIDKIPGMVDKLQQALSESTVTGDFFDGLALSFGGISQAEFQKRSVARHNKRLEHMNRAQQQGLAPGLFNDLTNIGKEWLGALRHGIPEAGPDGVKMPEFKLTVPELKIPEPPKIEFPDKYVPDFSDLGKGMAALSKIQLLDTAVYDSADYAKRVYEYEQNMDAIQAGLRGEPQKEGIEKQQLKALQGIEKNTRPAAAPAAANFSPT